MLIQRQKEIEKIKISDNNSDGENTRRGIAAAGAEQQL